MRVLQLSWEYPPHLVGGIGTHVAALAPALTRRGVQVSVVTPRWAGGDAVERGSAAAGGAGLAVYRVDPPVQVMGNFYADAQQTNLNLEEVAHSLWQSEGGFDLIHAHDWLVAFAAGSLKRLYKAPLIATIHATERGRGRGVLGGEMAQAINGAEWWLTYEAWRVITTSAYMADEVKNYFQVPRDKISVVPNGVTTTPFDALDGIDLGDFRAQWAAPHERIVFFVGRLYQEKGAQLIVEAAPRILAQFPGCKFIIAGNGSLGPQLNARAWELGVGNRVSVTGFIPDEARNKLLKVADAAVFPSLYEPFGIVALEAMAARCPVVVSQVGGLAEVVTCYETGITVYPDNVESLAWGILYTLQHPDLAREWSDKAYRMVREEYNWDRIATRTRDVYEEVIQARAATDW